MDSKKKEYVANRIFNSVFKSKAKEEWGVDLNLKINLDSDNYYDKWSYEFITLPSKFVLKNPNEDGWNEDRYWFINKVVKSILMEVLDYTGIYGNDTFPHKVMSTSYDDDFYKFQSRGPDQFVTSDTQSYEKESTNKKTLERNANLPSFILDNHGGVTSKLSGINYTVFANGNIDENDPFFLGDIENSDWWDGLDDDTKNEFVKYFG
jgi:hypothetical protein